LIVRLPTITAAFFPDGLIEVDTKRAVPNFAVSKKSALLRCSVNPGAVVLSCFTSNVTSTFDAATFAGSSE